MEAWSLFPPLQGDAKFTPQHAAPCTETPALQRHLKWCWKGNNPVPCHQQSFLEVTSGRQADWGIYKRGRERLNQQQSWPFSKRLLSAATLPDENERREWNLGRKERGELWKGKTKHLPDRGSPGLSRLQHNGDGGVSLVQGGVGVVFWHRWRCGRTKSNALVIRQLLPLVVMAT